MSPDSIPALLNLAQLDLQQKDSSLARKRFEAVLAKAPKNVAAMVGMAKIEALNKNEKESVAWLEKAKIADPKSHVPRLLLGAYDLRTGQYAKALDELTEAERYNQDNPEVLDLLAQAQAGTGQKANAIATYKRFIALRPNSPLAYYHLGMAQILTENDSAAAESLRKAIQLKPDYVEPTDALVGLELRTGRPLEALKAAQDLQKAAPKSIAGFVLEGDAQMSQQRYPEAAKAYEKAFAMSPSGPLVVKLHVASVKAGNIKGAQAALQQWLTSHPDDIGALQYSAGENLERGQTRQAIEQYERVLQKDPNNAIALNNLAILYQREKNPRALELAERAYKVVPDSSTTSDTLGWILVESGNTARGLQLLQNAAEKDPGNAEVRYHLAVALAKSGFGPRARKELESLLATERSFPQREAAEQLLKQL